jgi:hypothetical protein
MYRVKVFSGGPILLVIAAAFEQRYGREDLLYVGELEHALVHEFFSFNSEMTS